MLYRTDDLRIQSTEVVVPPYLLEQELPKTAVASATVYNARNEIRDILSGKDHRLLVVVGPCSIHDTKAAREYGELLKQAIAELSEDLRIVMRVYFEKPRTTVGWKGLINDLYLDGSYKINDGLLLARHLLLYLAEMGVPAGTEFLDMITPQYVTALASWGAIGARTTESQVHRQVVSGLSCAVEFKNATSGDTHIAIDAVLSAFQPHCFLGHTEQGRSAIFLTRGDPGCHVILRGGRGTVSYTADAVADVCAQLQEANPTPRVIVDFSHANSNKDYTKQSLVCRDVASRIARGNRSIIGVMLESNLVAGAQKLLASQPLVYGQSITDGCLGRTEALELLHERATAGRCRGIFNP